MYNRKSDRPANRANDRQLPDVIESGSDTPFDGTESLSDTAAFRILLKRNLPPQRPPADLLARIRGRVDKLKRENPNP